MVPEFLMKDLLVWNATRNPTAVMFSPLLLQSRRWKCQSKQRLLRVNQSIWRLQNSILKTGPHSCLHPSPVSVLG